MFQTYSNKTDFKTPTSITINKGDAQVVGIVSYIVKPSTNISITVFQPQGYVVSDIIILTKIYFLHDGQIVYFYSKHK